MLQEIFDNTAHYEYIPHLRINNDILYSYLWTFNPHLPGYEPLYKLIRMQFIIIWTRNEKFLIELLIFIETTFFVLNYNEFQDQRFMFLYIFPKF